MALTESEKQALNQAFNKLLQVGGLPNGVPDSLIQIITDIGSTSGGADVGDVTVNPTFATQAAVTYYVETTGSDSNDGSIGLPFLTIQKAFNSLPSHIAHPVIINVGAGNFSGARIFGLTVLPGTDPSVGAYVALVGTLGAASITGLQVGDIASATAGSDTSGTYGTATVTGAGWTVDDLRGKFIQITAGTSVGTVRAIVSNTDSVVTIAGAWGTTPTSSSDFAIVEPATVINASILSPVSYDGSASQSAFGFVVDDVFGGASGGLLGSIFISQVRITTQRAISSNAQAPVVMRRSWMDRVAVGGGVGEVFGNMFPASLRFDDCYMGFSGTSGVGWLLASGSELTLRRNVVDNGAEHIRASSGTRVTMQSNSLKAANIASLMLGQMSLSMEGDKIDAVTPGSRIGVQFNSTANPSSGPAGARLSAVAISNCGTAISMSGVGGVILTGAISGMGNTTGIGISKGAAVQISSTTTLTGTTELSIDGSAFTLAQMRAAVPKSITSVEYGTKVYE